MGSLAIGEVARQAGVRPSAIRYYESLGLLPPPERINGRRRYGPEVLRRLAVVRMAQEAGFTLAETRTLFDGFAADAPASVRWRALAARKLAEVEALIARAEETRQRLHARLRCACPTLDECALLDRSCPADPAG